MVISGPVLQGEEPLALQTLHCTPINQSDRLPRPVRQSEDSPPSGSRGDGCEGRSQAGAGPSGAKEWTRGTRGHQARLARVRVRDAASGKRR